MCRLGNTTARSLMLSNCWLLPEVFMFRIINKTGIGIVVIAALIASPVLAAKTKKIVKAPPPPMPVYSWTGYYIGANVGGVCSNVTANRGNLTTTFGPLDPLGFVDFTDRIGLLGQ